jgi:hypothetical protein
LQQLLASPLRCPGLTLFGRPIHRDHHDRLQAGKPAERERHDRRSCWRRERICQRHVGGSDSEACRGEQEQDGDQDERRTQRQAPPNVLRGL